MRKKFLLLALIIIAGLQAQNIQLHYDFRHSVKPEVANKNYVTATFEWLHFDKLGSTFMFADADFNKENGNLGLIYAEISRTFNFGKSSPFAAQLEYNGGIGNWGGVDDAIPNSYLGGVAFAKPIGPVFINTYLAYKFNNYKKASHDMQWTLVWNSNFFNDKLTFNGFVDVWSENKDRINGHGGKKVVFMSEPQLWYNITPKFAVGSEVELSSNFVNNKFNALPTIGIKYTFNK